MTNPVEAQPAAAAERSSSTEWPLWEVFVRSKAGLDHKHCGSLHARRVHPAPGGHEPVGRAI